ncbi:hypothetical protein NQD34_003455 [Periophthalmus magnuspinnatus]|nr:hypothetical protein NQD34_003455 [Periophthalmus magnuspinnatus]
MWHLHRQQQNSLSSIPLSSLSSPSSLSSSSPLPPVEFMLLLQSWRDLLVFQSREESELIKHLDQEAATCIKKVVSDLLKGTTTELRELHTPVLLQTERPLQHTEEAAVAQESRGCTTEEPQGALQRELGEQRDIREQCRIFFRRLLSSQLSLSDSDLLKLKLEYQKCFSVMDRCLVVPPAVLRAKVQRGLEEWRRSQEKLMSRGKRKSTKEESELRRFKKNLQERLKLYEQSHKKEMELREEMEQQMRSDSQAPLLSLSERLSSLLVSLHLDKVQSWSQVLQTWEAILCLQSLLIPELRERPEMATEIRAHREGLAAAEEEFQQDLCRVDIDLAPPVDTDPLTTLSSVSPPPPIPPLLEDGVLEVKPDCNMGSILQEALSKREQLLSLLSQKSEESTSRTQIREDLRQHLELRRLQQLCAQDVKFTSVLVRLLEVPRDVLMQMLCVLLPALPERELLSLCESLSPKDLPQCPRLSSLNHLIVKLRADFTREASLDAPVCTGQTDRMEEKRRCLLEKLLSSVCAPPPSATPLILVQPEIGTRSETGPEIGTRPGSDFLKLCLVKPDPDEYMCLSRSSPDLDPGPCPSTVLSSDAHAVHSERLFIFRDMPVSAQTPEGAIRKRRRNFLNLKKSSVAPLISDS